MSVFTVGDTTSATYSATYLVVDVDEVSKLFCEYPAAVVDGEFATGDSHSEQLVQVAGCPLQKPQHQVLVETHTRYGLVITVTIF